MRIKVNPRLLFVRNGDFEQALKWFEESSLLGDMEATEYDALLQELQECMQKRQLGVSVHEVRDGEGPGITACRAKLAERAPAAPASPDPVVLGAPPAESTRLPTHTIEIHQTKTESERILAQQTLSIQSNKMLAEPRERFT